MVTTKVTDAEEIRMLVEGVPGVTRDDGFYINAYGPIKDGRIEDVVVVNRSSFRTDAASLMCSVEEFQRNYSLMGI